MVKGDIFGRIELTDERIPAPQATLLAPVVPSQVVAIGLNCRTESEASWLTGPPGGDPDEERRGQSIPQRVQEVLSAGASPGRGPGGDEWISLLAATDQCKVSSGNKQRDRRGQSLRPPGDHSGLTPE
jgi:hypothetical protein